MSGDIERPDCPNGCERGRMVACGIDLPWWECSNCGVQIDRERRTVDAEPGGER